MEITHELLAVRQMKFGAVKDHGHTCKFCLNRYVVRWSFSIWQWCKIL